MHVFFFKVCTRNYVVYVATVVLNAVGFVAVLIGLVILNIGGLYDSVCEYCGYLRIAMMSLGVVAFILIFVFTIALPVYIQSGYRTNYQANLSALLTQQQQIQPQQLQPQVYIQAQQQQQQPVRQEQQNQQQPSHMQQMSQPNGYANMGFAQSSSATVYPTSVSVYAPSGNMQQHQQQQQTFGVYNTPSI
jgi:hypothetical protein